MSIWGDPQNPAQPSKSSNQSETKPRSAFDKLEKRVVNVLILSQVAPGWTMIDEPPKPIANMIEC